MEGCSSGYRTGYLEGLAVLKPPTSFHHAIDWLDRPQWALAVSFVVLVAATLQASVMRRSAQFSQQERRCLRSPRLRS